MTRKISHSAAKAQPNTKCQFPRDIEQLIIGGRIVGRSHDPVIERREVSQRPGHVGDLVRDLANLLGHRQQELRAKAIRRERDSGLRFGRVLYLR